MSCPCTISSTSTLLMTVGVATAQQQPPVRFDGSAAGAVEIAINSKNGGVDCSPRHLKLLARGDVDLRLANHADQPRIFFADEFSKVPTYRLAVPASMRHGAKSVSVPG